MKQLFFLLLFCVAMASCSRLPVATVAQPHVITRIDTVGKKNIRLIITPVGNPRTIYGKPFHTGDTLQVLLLKPVKS